MDLKLFKKTFKFVCNECGEFGHTQTEYCEKCGAMAMRKATNEDYLRYETESKRDAKEDRIGFEKVKETRKVAERAEKVAEKARMVAEKADPLRAMCRWPTRAVDPISPTTSRCSSPCMTTPMAPGVR